MGPFNPLSGGPGAFGGGGADLNETSAGAVADSESDTENWSPVSNASGRGSAGGMGSTGGSRRSASRRGSSSAQSFTHHRQQSTPMPTSSAALASSSTATGPDKDCGSVVFSVERSSDPESPRWCRLRLTNVRYEAGPNSSLPETKISLRVTLMPERDQQRDTLTSLMEGYSAAFLDRLAFHEVRMQHDVLKIAVINRTRHKRTYHGFGVLELKDLLLDTRPTTTPGPSPPDADGNCQLEVPEQAPSRINQWTNVSVTILPSVSEKLVMIFSNTVTLGLIYDTSQEKLTLTLVEAKVLPISIKYNPVSYYGKVTLFGDGRVVKAKKTRPVASQRRQEQQQISSFSSTGSGEERPIFDESFNILFPPDYLSRVSCIISLCGKTRAGSKIVFGRTCLGSEQCSKNLDGIQHWKEMCDRAARQNEPMVIPVIKTHHLTL